MNRQMEPMDVMIYALAAAVVLAAVGVGLWPYWNYRAAESKAAIEAGLVQDRGGYWVKPK